jgi:hypothetical protein
MTSVLRDLLERGKGKVAEEKILAQSVFSGRK